MDKAKRINEKAKKLQVSADVAVIDEVRDAGARADKILRNSIPGHVLGALQEDADGVAKLIAEQLGIEAPHTLIALEKLPRKVLGQYHPGRDGLGLRWRIDLNTVHLNRSRADIVRTILHEILHAVQDDYGDAGNAKKRTHNAEFQAWVWWFGLPCGGEGHDEGTVKGSLFDEYCKAAGLGATGAFVPSEVLPKAGGSKLKKWSCECGINLRVAVNLDASCNICKTKFKLQDKSDADVGEGE